MGSARQGGRGIISTRPAVSVSPSYTVDVEAMKITSKDSELAGKPVEYVSHTLRTHELLLLVKKKIDPIEWSICSTGGNWKSTFV